MPLPKKLVATALFLALCLAGGPSFAEAAPNPTGSAKLSQALETRDAWQESLELVRTGMKFEIAASEDDEAHTFWLFLERTPSGRMRMIVKDAPGGVVHMNFMVQDGVCLVKSAGRVDRAAAPWMLGHYLFGQAMEPAMLLQWALGLPGQNFQAGAEIARVSERDGQLASIEQAGWQVDYINWKAPTPGAPALPAQMEVRGQTVSMRISVVHMEPHAQAPEGYTEFALM